MNSSAGKYVIIFGVIVVIIGLIIYFFGNKLGFLGRLPGDIVVERENFRFYFPIVTSILLSVLSTIASPSQMWFGF